MSFIIPPRLKPGDTVGIVSPSAGIAHHAPHRIEQATRTLERLGFRTLVGEHAMKARGYVSGTVEERVEDLHAMFANPDVKMVMCAIGGNHSNQLLRHLDYDLIRNNPKIFVGYSDITVLHLALQSQAGLATYFGPCAMTQFGEYPEVLPYTLDHFLSQTVKGHEYESQDIRASEMWTDEFLDWMEKRDLSRARKQLPNSGHEWLNPGKASGPAWGGTLYSINHLSGTPYWTDPTDAICFLDILKEEDLTISAADAFLADLKNLAVFDRIAGLIIGRPQNYSEEEAATLKETILRYVGKNTYPILFNANIGHTDPILTIRYGQRIELDSNNNAFILHSH